MIEIRFETGREDQIYFSIGLVIGAILGLTVPHQTWIKVLGTLFVGALKAIAPLLVFVLVSSSLACFLFGISNDVAMQIVGVGFIISVIQDSLETALNSSGDVIFTATAEFMEWKKQGKKLPL